MLGKALTSLLTPSYTALDLLKDEGSARAYVYARADVAEFLTTSMVWEPTEGYLLRSVYRDIIIFRDVSGVAIGTTLSPKWGVVRIGNANFRVDSEAQVIAYIIARYHTFKQEKVGALLSKVKEET